jgi:hypothetical protein
MRQPSPNETALEPPVVITEGEEILSELQEGDGGTVVNSKTKHAVVISTEEHMTTQQGRKFPNHKAACVQVGNEERVSEPPLTQDPQIQCSLLDVDQAGNSVRVKNHC